MDKEIQMKVLNDDSSLNNLPQLEKCIEINVLSLSQNGNKLEQSIEMQDVFSLNFDDIKSMSDYQIRQHRDARGFNILMLAAEAGHIEAVNDLINRCDINFEVGDESAVNVAFNGRHHEIVLALLKANAKFPKDFSAQAAKDELKRFLDLSCEMHDRVRKANEDDENARKFLRENVESNPTLKYFYDTSNCSLVKASLDARKFQFLKFLWQIGLKLSPHEDLKAISKSFSVKEKENLKRCHLEFFDKFFNLSNIEINNFRDFRDFTALMVAAEYNMIDAVKYFIEQGFILDAMVNDQTAASLACANENFEVLLMLLEGNSEFPANLNPNEIENVELKKFIEMSQNIHNLVDTNECEKIEKILQNESVKYFYDLKNRSLFRHVIESKNFEIYKILIQNRVFFGPYESYNAMLSKLSDDERLELSEIQIELADPLASPTVLSLMAHSFVGHDSKNEKRAAAMEAFSFLLTIPRAKIILKIVATQKDYQIVFDFSRDDVQFVDPKAELYSSGMFYSQGRIYIAAKKLFDDDGKYEVMGALIHELCHFAMYIVFDNFAKPFHEFDGVKENEFEKIVKACEDRKRSEELIRIVYAEYNADWRPTELIVRAVQIDVHYHGLDVLEQKQEDFKELYDYYDHHCMTEMEQILPALEAKANFTEKDEKIEKLRKFNIGLFLMVILSIILGGLVAFLIFNPTISWSDLDSNDKNFVKNATVKFHGVEVKFGELFQNDSKVFGLLSSEQIKKALKGESEELSKALNETLHHQVFLTWSNMTKELKEKFLNREVDFQGQKVSIGKITKSDETLKLLHSENVRKIFTTNSFKISFAVQEKTKIFIERFFVDQNATVVSERAYKFPDGTNRTDIEKFYKNGQIDTENFKIKSLTQIVESFNTSKVFLLSSAAGDGKSTAFRHFSIKLKEIFPQKWIQFVALKDIFEVFDKNQQIDFNNFELLSDFLGKKVLNLERFELEIFKELFKLGNVIFLWDGVDEISPKFEDEMFELTVTLSERTKNFQFISTRPRHSKDFEDGLEVEAHKLIPFSELDRFEFLVKMIANIKFNESGNEAFDELKHLYKQSYETFHNFSLQPNASKYFKHLARGQGIFKAEMTYEIVKTKSKKNLTDTFVSNPLLISMISEIACNDNFTIERDKNCRTCFIVNSFDLFKTFIIKKLNRIRSKGKLVENDRDEAIAESAMNIWQVHQFFALDFITKKVDLFESRAIEALSFIEEGKKKSLKAFTIEQISRFEILQVNSEIDFDFAHRSFAEFFVAQFFLDNVLLKAKKDDKNKEEEQWKTSLFFEFDRSSDFFAFINDASTHERYDSVNDEVFMMALIKDAYVKNLTDVENIINFIESFEWPLETTIIILSSLYLDMMTNNHTESFDFTMLYYLVETFPVHPHYEDLEGAYKFVMNNLRRGLSIKSKKGVKKFADEIKNGDYEKIFKWVNKFHYNIGSVELALPDIVTAAYSNKTEEFLNLLNFLRKAANFNQYWICFISLRDEIRLRKDLESFELLVFYYTVKEFMLMPNYPFIPSNQKEMFESLELEMRNKSEEGIEKFGVKIRSGEYEKVLMWAEKFNTFGSSFVLALPDLLVSAYSKNLTDFLNVLKFMENLINYFYQAISLSTLYEMMEGEESLDSLIIIILDFYADQAIDRNDDSYLSIPENLRLKFETLSYEFDEKYNENEKYFEELGMRVKNGDFQGILEWSIKLPNCFGYALSDLIKSSYSNDSNEFFNDLNFIRNFPTIYHKIAGLLYIHKEMRVNNYLESSSMLMLTNEVKETFNDIYYYNADEASKILLKELKRSLPPNVRNFIWSLRKNCTIKSEKLASSFNGSARIIVSLQGAKWSIQTENFAKSFTFENLERNEFLSIADDNNNVLLQKLEADGKNFHWQIIPIDEKYLIVNENLTIDEVKGRVFMSDLNDNATKWQINCQDYPRFENDESIWF